MSEKDKFKSETQRFSPLAGLVEEIVIDTGSSEIGIVGDRGGDILGEGEARFGCGSALSNDKYSSFFNAGDDDDDED